MTTRRIPSPEEFMRASAARAHRDRGLLAVIADGNGPPTDEDVAKILLGAIDRRFTDGVEHGHRADGERLHQGVGVRGRGGDAACGLLSIGNGSVGEKFPFQMETADALGLKHGKVYEVAVFQAERQTECSTYKLTLTGFNMAPSQCVRK